MNYKIDALTAVKNIVSAILKGRFKTVSGYMRYFLYNLAPNTPEDYSILLLLLHECGLPLDRHTLSCLLDKRPTIVRFVDGTRFVVVDLEDFYHASMCYESKTLAYVLRRLTKGGVFVDVGANVGGYAIRAAKTARVYALEPEPRNFHLLKLNVKLNQKCDVVRVFQVAAGSSSGKAKLFISDYHGRHSLLHSQAKA